MDNDRIRENLCWRAERCVKELALMHIVKINFAQAKNFGSAEQLAHKWQLFDLPHAITKLGAQVTLVQLSDRELEFTKDNVRIYFVPAPTYIPRSLLHRLPLLNLLLRIRGLSPDVIHIEGLHFPFHTYWIKKVFPDTPLFVQDHANKMPATFFRSRFYQFIFERVDGVLFSAVELADVFFERGYFPQRLSIFEVLEGTTTFAPAENQEWRDTRKKPRFVAVGDLIETKDPLTVLLAFKAVLEKLPEATLDFYFRRDFMKLELEEVLSASASLRDRVRLMGAIEHDDLEEVFRNTDYFISGSTREGGAYSLIEALACGVTPVVTDIPVHRTVLKDGLVGKLYRIGDHTELASKIIEAHNESLPEVRRMNRRHFEKYLAVDVIAQRLLDIYRSV